MNLQHLTVKLPVDGDLAVDPGRFIEIFHAWVREQPMPELLIDVADYRHVPDGPGILLVGLQADRAVDHMEGRWGVLYRRKDVLPGTDADRVRQALAAVLATADRLERDLEGQIRFSRTAFDLIVNDRLLAPNTDEGRRTTTSILQAALESVLGQAPIITPHDPDPRRRFGVSVACSKPIAIAPETQTAG